MSELQVIESALDRAARRRRWDRALRGLWQGVFVGASIWLVALAAYKLLPIPLVVLGVAAAAAITCPIGGLVIGGWRKPALAEVARWIDVKQHLQERLSTALEFGNNQAHGQNDDAWRQLVVSDATSHVKDFDPRRLIQFHLTKASRWALLILALCAGLGFVPEYRSKSYVQKQADQNNIKEVGRQLTELTKRNLERRPPALETTQKSMENVSELGTNLVKQTLTRSEALKDIASVSDKLKDQLNQMKQDPALKRMEQAARANGGENSPDVSRLQKQIDDAKKQMGDPKATPEAMDKMKHDLEKIQEAATAAMNKDGSMSAADKQQLSQSLTSLSKQAQEMGLQAPNIDQAIQALAASQSDMFLKDLQASVNDLEKMSEMSKSLAQMQQQMEKLGKDLGEQLKNGQAEAAQSTLQKMMEQLKSQNMSQEALSKMVDEVTKAVDPGSQYGKVGEHLKDAAKQLGQGQKGQASQSLADASKELEKLMQQMNDAQSLMAEMEALNKASMCVGSCQGWGQCNKPGMGKGGKPGSGVGTWADEDAGWGYDGHMTDRWDNTGAVRPDTDSRGITDRGDGEMNDALKPTKVKGQFSPGGQMPSITLKGVSIKGQSKVAYEESAVAAQADAQSALSQEKVPRAYQGAVRDYFDDLKK